MKQKAIKKEDTPHRIFEKITSLYLYCMITVFILWCGTGGYQDLQSAKYSIFLALCAGYIVAMFLCAVELTLIGTLKVSKPAAFFQQLSLTQKLVICYLIITWISAVTSAHFPDTIIGVSRNEGALTISIYCIVFLLVSTFGVIKKPMLYVFSATVTIFSLICILQLAGLNPFNLYPEGLTYMDAYTKYSGAYLGTIGNVDLVASFLCIAIPLLWIPILRLKDSRRWLLLIPLSMALFVLIRMSVMAGYVGIFIGTVICLPFVLPVSKRVRRIVGIVIIIVALASLVTLRICDFDIELLHQIHEILNGNIDASFGSGRIHIWKEVLQHVPSHILLGYGPDTMHYGALEAFTRYDAALDITIVSQIDTAHNEYLNVLYHQGILALVAYLSALVTTFIKFVRNSPGNGTISALGGAVICYLVQAFFGFSMCVVAPLFWITFALLEYHLKMTDKRTGEKLCGKS